jgi:hypothetical protein
VRGSTVVDLEARCTHLNHLKEYRRVDFAKSQVLKLLGPSIERGRMASDQHFANSHIREVKGSNL